MSEVKAKMGISAIVLRFRDKGEDVNDTIKEHCDYIANKKYVWWGWWAKDYELPPYDYFDEISDCIQSNKQDFKIFLLHTKSKVLYEAKCTAIKYSDNRESGSDGSIQTPDPDATPSYYNKASAKLWLRFISIKECTDNSVLFNNTYSFLADSDLFFSKPGKWSDNHLVASFKNCKVSQIEEFLVQQRTIWFLRSQADSDSDTRIDEWLPLPGNFAQHHARARQGAYKLLVLSDLHFCKDSHHNFHVGSKRSREKLTLIQALQNQIAGPGIGGIDGIAGVLIAGDFVFRPTAEEFKIAKDFIKELLDTLRLKPEQLAIVPGNHDIAYLGSSTDPVDGDDIPPEACDEAKMLYREFYESIYNATPNHYLCGCRRIMLPNHLPIEIICVNSCVLQQEKDSFVQGYVGEFQWDDIKTQLNMKPDIKTYAYRILLIHHHLTSTSIYSEKPRKDKNYNILLDAGSVSHNVRKYNIKLVVHGHGHESGYDYSAPRKKNNEASAPNSYDIISMGSAGSNDLPPGEKNTFGILDFSEFGKVRYEKYELGLTRREESLPDYYKPKECWDMPIF